MMLAWIGEHQNSDVLVRAGRAMEMAVDSVLADPASRTADLGGSLGCQAFGKRVADAVCTV